MEKGKLDQIVLDAEFLLISVIQGVALATLAANAASLMGNLQLEYWLYVISAFLFILNFWAQAIIHAISFINWPMSLPHNFFYFLASFIEVIAFAHLSDPLKWFAFIFIFFCVAAILYFVDLQLIKLRSREFLNSPQKRKLFQHILSRQKFEISFLLPSALLFHLIAFLLIYFYPNFFITNRYHIAFVAIQVLFGIGVLYDLVRNFHKRSDLISHVQIS